MSKRIKELYHKAGLKPPNGKGIHSHAFHSMAVAIKTENPEYTWSRCYAIAMNKLGRNRAVKKGHRRGVKILGRPRSELRKVAA